MRRLKKKIKPWWAAGGFDAGPLSLYLWSLHQVTDAVEDLVQAADGEEGEDKRGWWLTADKAADGTKLRPALSTHYVGWEETVRVLVAAAREHGPFDGILGFSQVSGTHRARAVKWASIRVAFARCTHRDVCTR